jgi:hypothetical protein
MSAYATVPYDIGERATPRYSSDTFEEVRAILSPEFDAFSDEQIEIMLESSGVSAEEFESLLKSLKRIGQAALPIVRKVAPIAGGAVGSLVAPGIGTAIGAQLGGMAGQALGNVPQPGRRQTRTRRRRRAPAGRTPQRAPAGRTSRVARPQGSPAAVQLMQTMFRPEVLQALMSSIMGGAGNSRTQVGRTSVPVGSIANMLSVLASRAAAESNMMADDFDDGIPDYLMAEDGQYYGDPMSPEDRADALYALLQEAALIEALNGDEGEEIEDDAELYEESDFEDDWLDDVDEIAEDEDEAYFALLELADNDDEVWEDEDDGWYG